MNWETRANCRGVSVNYFYSDGNNSYDGAAALCGACPVVAECLSSAITAEANIGPASVHGYRGGTHPADRKRLVIARIRTDRAGVAS